MMPTIAPGATPALTERKNQRHEDGTLWTVLDAPVDGAACVGARALFDRTRMPSKPSLQDRIATESARAQAVALCESCPALTPCRQWYDSLAKSERPSGVMAGRLKTPGKAGGPRKLLVR